MGKRIFSILCVGVMCLLLLYPMKAEAFTDDAQIGAAYREAVTAMSDLGVICGFEDGSFQPLGTLTREQGAKIVTFLLLGESQAQRLRVSAAPFPDVAADRWSAPCIAWCVDQGILNGFPDGNYYPADELTGYQFTKMLLCAYGYGTGKDYAGDRWPLSVVKDGRANGFFAGDETMATDDALQRQQAALLGHNAWKAEQTQPPYDPRPEPMPGPTPTPKPTPTLEPTDPPGGGGGGGIQLPDDD